MTPWGQFWRDTATALALWGRAPGLPLLTLALAMAVHSTAISGVFVLLAFPASAFFGGFMGTQRLWYWRALENRPLSGAEVWRFTWRYFWRFFWLAMLVALASVLLSLVVAVAPWVAGMEGDSAWLIGSLVTAFVVDVALTFVTPALSLTTPKIGEAWDIGWGMLRSRWSEVKWHALMPPLVLTVGVQTAPPGTFNPGVLFTLGVTGWMLNLLFKGAQLMAYLEERAPAPPPG